MLCHIQCLHFVSHDKSLWGSPPLSLLVGKLRNDLSHVFVFGVASHFKDKQLLSSWVVLLKLFVSTVSIITSPTMSKAHHLSNSLRLIWSCQLLIHASFEEFFGEVEAPIGKFILLFPNVLVLFYYYFLICWRTEPSTSLYTFLLYSIRLLRPSPSNVSLISYCSSLMQKHSAASTVTTITIALIT